MSGHCERFIGITGGRGYLGWGNPAHNPNGYVDSPVSEDAPVYTDPNQSRFGTMVSLGEKTVMECHNKGAYKATILRYPSVYGPRQLHSSIWPVVKRILDGRKRIIIPGDGLQLRAVRSSLEDEAYPDRKFSYPLVLSPLPGFSNLIVRISIIVMGRSRLVLKNRHGCFIVQQKYFQSRTDIQKFDFIGEPVKNLNMTKECEKL